MGSQNMKNLVLGFATNQDYESVSVFCKSLREVYGENACDVVLAVNQPSIFDLCLKYNVTPILTVNNYQSRHAQVERMLKWTIIKLLAPIRSLGKGSSALSSLPNLFFEATLHPHLARWFFYQRVLQTVPTPRKVLITDVSDVFFQARFFEQLSEDQLYFFCESGEYGKSRWNDENYIKLYGRAEYQKIIGQPAVCMGVLGGGLSPIQKIIEWIVNSVNSRPNKGSDQVRGNRFANLNRQNSMLNISRNGKGLVIHLNVSGLVGSDSSSMAALSNNSLVGKEDGRLIPIVHMYNRNSEVNATVQQRWL